MNKTLAFIIFVAVLAGGLVVGHAALACHGDCGGGSPTCAQACGEGGMASYGYCVDYAPADGYVTNNGIGKRNNNGNCGGWGQCTLRNCARDFQCNSGFTKVGGGGDDSNGPDGWCRPNCAGNQGNSCQSGANACGMRNNGTIQCSGACSASTPPNSSCPAPSCSALPANAIPGQTVTATAASGVGPYSWNSGSGGNPATTSGNPRTFTYATTGAKTITVTDTATGRTNTCSTTICTANYNQACQTVGANACGMHGSGTYQCDGSCNAVVPPVSACPAPSCVAAPASPQTGQVVTATGSSGIPPYSWNTGGGIPPTGNGASINTLYSSSGAKTITISDSNGKSGTCNVNVGAAFTANGTVTTSPAHPGTLGYNTAYKVRVRVWDDQGTASDWSDVLTPFSYSTKPGPLPAVSFTYAPGKVIAKQQVTFTDTSTNGPINAWEWNFGDSTPKSNVNPASHIYAAEGSYSVTLKASNAFGSCVSAPQNLGVIKPIPTYREIRPGQSPLPTPSASPRPSPTPTPPPSNPNGAGENGR